MFSRSPATVSCSQPSSQRPRPYCIQSIASPAVLPLHFCTQTRWPASLYRHCGKAVLTFHSRCISLIGFSARTTIPFSPTHFLASYQPLLTFPEPQHPYPGLVLPSVIQEIGQLDEPSLK